VISEITIISKEDKTNKMFKLLSKHKNKLIFVVATLLIFILMKITYESFIGYIAQDHTLDQTYTVASLIFIVFSILLGVFLITDISDKKLNPLNKKFNIAYDIAMWLGIAYPYLTTIPKG